ncbi:MAG: nicotinate-nucleotide adenylyltransferase [Candidatus Omnitrophica bacterium]|nr:nicotinate-nucleotide adenylyltransferase [Candidatus Omnitrophota bacterium]MDE2221600.1 nicotinate-nucleotide adenylyltransferase [Candidatus Omnitrophota bacterium]
MKRIGVLGGSFDPIHFGHLLMAQSALEALKLDMVLFVPAYCSPFKAGRTPPDASKRLVMVEEAIKGNKAFKVYDGELRRKQISYTIDTLKELKEKYPQSQLFLLLGADNLKTFHRWKEPQGILKLAKLVILNRPGFDKESPKRWPHVKVNMPAVDISSSDLRQRLKTSKSIWYLTPKAVIRYIKRYHLYGFK